jgi:hypothetical protein
MHRFTMGHSPPVAINLNQPRHVPSWSFLDITLANLKVIALMVVVQAEQRAS